MVGQKTYVDQLGEIRHRSPKEQVGFAQMWHVITLDCGLTDAAYRLYGLLLMYAQQRGKCTMTVQTLADGLCKGPRTIQYELRELEARGLISREERTGTTPITWIEDVNVIYRDEIEELLAKRDA